MMLCPAQWPSMDLLEGTRWRTRLLDNVGKMCLSFVTAFPKCLTSKK